MLRSFGISWRKLKSECYGLCRIESVLSWLIVGQFKEYLERAEYIKKCMDGKQEVQQSSGNGVGPSQKSKPSGGGGGGGGKDDVRLYLPAQHKILMYSVYRLCVLDMGAKRCWCKLLQQDIAEVYREEIAGAVR